jgi:hypothetical protein
MWVAVFIQVTCGSRQPMEVGEFDDQTRCLRWVAQVQAKYSRIKGTCKPRAFNTKSQRSG